MNHETSSSEFSQRAEFSNKQEAFIAKAKLVHGDNYDYDLSQYTTTHTKLKIRCPVHGVFEQTPNDHLSKKSGCPSCALIRRTATRTYTTDTFIQKAQAVHGTKYDYTATNYITSKHRVSIICPIHGEFTQHAARHLIGHGCKKCRNDIVHTWTSSNITAFVERANIIHTNKYDYTDAVYIKNSKKVQIICPIHGHFEQTPNKHLAGCGCKKCAKSGFSLKANRWLADIEQQLNRCIIGAHRTHEYHIPGTRFHADGFDECTNTIYEFYGNKWHGNIAIYNTNDHCHPFTNDTAGMLYQKTMDREEKLRELGYNIISIWEHDYDTRTINDNQD